MGNFDWKDKKNIFAILIVLLLGGGAFAFYEYEWKAFEIKKQDLEQQLSKAQNDLAKINVQKNRIAELSLRLAQAENEFERLKEMFPEEEKVPLRLQDLYAVLRSSGVQIQKFNPEGRETKDYYIENKYSIVVNSGYHMLGYLFAEIANFNYPTSITDLRLGRYSGIATELEKAETHGWTPITVSVSFKLTTYTSKKAAQ